jgi:hypothetical protein
MDMDSRETTSEVVEWELMWRFITVPWFIEFTSWCPLVMFVGFVTLKPDI